VDEADLAEALDAPEPRPALLELLVAIRKEDVAAACAADAHVATLRTELEGLRLGALGRRAAAAGAVAETLEEILDSAAPAEGMIELVLRLELEVASSAGSAGSAANVSPHGGGEKDGCAPLTNTLARSTDKIAPLRPFWTGAVDAALASLRAELEALKLGALQRRARAVGVDEAQLADALDEEKPHPALVELLAKAELQRRKRPAVAAPPLNVQRRHEPGHSKQLAQAPQAVQQPPKITASQRRPHHGLSGDLASGSSAPAGTVARSGGARSVSSARQSADARRLLPQNKWAMLSYQWDIQDTVVRARDALQARGVQCWMDIAAGMQADLYDSMAAGVQGACVVLCFMTEKYQESDNCKLELQFAKQTGTPIVPVMMENPDRGWSASGWLGIITAGALWQPLFDDAQFAAGIDGVVCQIQKVVQCPAADDGNSTGAHSVRESAEDEVLFSLAEMRAELDRLRSEATTPTAVPTHGSGATSRAAGALCVLPAAVPCVPPSMRVSAQMRVLVNTLIAPEAKLRVGFHGMGGKNVIVWRPES
jgi:hypothetical protein